MLNDASYPIFSYSVPKFSNAFLSNSAEFTLTMINIILKRTSTEAHVYMWHHQEVKVKHFDVSNVIYHKFSHGPVSYTLNGENVNVML